MTSPLPTHAQTGFADAAKYDAHRPSYPAEAVDIFLSRLNISERDGARIVELGSGTGKLTECLTAPARTEGFEIVAVEPHAGMREKLEAKALPGVESIDGDAGAVPLENGWADACIAAQAFHWFANESTIKEVHRLLKERAVFGMIWNIEDYNKPKGWTASTAWEQQLNDLVWSLPEDGTPRFRHYQWADVFCKRLKTTPFQALRDTLLHSGNTDDNLPRFSLPIGEERVPFTVWLADDALWSRFSTLSQVANLDDAARADVRARFDTILKRGEGVERNDAGELAVHGATFFAWTDRL